MAISLIFDNFLEAVYIMKLTTLFFISVAFMLTACNTVKGVGQDIGRAGNAIERAAK